MAIELQDIAGSTLISDLPAILNSNNTKIKNHFKTTIKTVNGKTPDANGDVVVSEGGTAPDLSQYYTKSESDAKYLTEHQSLAGYATEQWVENKNYLTQHQSLDGKQDKLSATQLANLNADHSKYITSLSGYATESFVTGKGYITSSALANISSTSVTTTNLTINGWAVTIV